VRLGVGLRVLGCTCLARRFRSFLRRLAVFATPQQTIELLRLSGSTPSPGIGLAPALLPGWIASLPIPSKDC